MIVRIMAEGQYRLSDEAFERLKDIDDHLLTALEEHDGTRFHRLFRDALAVVRNGEPLAQSLETSDLVLPPAETSMEEARRLMEAE